MQERRGAGRKPGEAHTPESLAAGNEAAQRLAAQRRGQGGVAGPGQPALAHAGGGGRRPTSRPIGRPGGNNGVSQMAEGKAGRSKLAKKMDSGKGRSGDKKPWTTPPSPIKARTRAVAYGKTDLSEKALAYRKKHNYWAGKNLAVFEYKDSNGIHRTVTAISDTGVHSEKAAWKALQAKGINADQITRIYSEREPCMLPGAFCGKFIDETFPQADVTYSFEYGDLMSRVRGNLQMKQTLSTLKKEPE